ncbi:MAG: hypothetical protein H7Z72_25680, partial [Bacteroidetes bacterium]|nr:hypothetical protein [Fibrella sp.]
MKRILVLLLTAALLPACQTTEQRDAKTILSQSWPQIEARGKNQPVSMVMWMGDPFINEYMSKYVRPEVKKRYGIDLQIGAAQGAGIVQTLMAEQQAGQPSEIDMAWINGETFYQMRQVKA